MRDSDAGYGNGKFAYSVVAVDVPVAIKAARDILGITKDIYEKQDSAEAFKASRLSNAFGTKSNLNDLAKVWEETEEFFYFEKNGTRYVDLALGQDGQNLNIINSDFVYKLSACNFTEEILRLLGAGKIKDANALMRYVGEQLEVFSKHYDEGGLRISDKASGKDLGFVVTNDMYASAQVQDGYTNDDYHGRKAMWGLYVTSLIQGLAEQINSSYGADGKLKNATLKEYIMQLEGIMKTVLASEVASREWSNFEVCFYESENGSCNLIPYRKTNCVQLWNTIWLVIHFTLKKYGLERLLPKKESRWKRILLPALLMPMGMMVLAGGSTKRDDSKNRQLSDMALYIFRWSPFSRGREKEIGNNYSIRSEMDKLEMLGDEEKLSEVVVSYFKDMEVHLKPKQLFRSLLVKLEAIKEEENLSVDEARYLLGVAESALTAITSGSIKNIRDYYNDYYFGANNGNKKIEDALYVELLSVISSLPSSTNALTAASNSPRVSTARFFFASLSRRFFGIIFSSTALRRIIFMALAVVLIPNSVLSLLAII